MRIKICGLTSVADAAYLNENQVDLAGIVLFYPKSRRNMTIAGAIPVLKALAPSIKKVAVTVCPTLEQTEQIAAAGFDYIQIHGKLTKELLENIQLPILKAFNITDMPEYPFYRSCPQIAGYIFDAQEPGSGKTFDWSLVTDLPKDDKLLFLAGGLHSGNVAQAINAVLPDGVDVSSGVEYDGRPAKDPEKIAAFVKAVRQLSY